MRITRDLLLSTARDTIKRYTFGVHDLVCAYITGSLVHDDPLIGGTTDIDLVYVHAIDTPVDREIIPVTDDFHLDIAHFLETKFSQPRDLRTDPWLGSFICHYPIPIYDDGHWFEYTQAGVFAHFYDPVNMYERVKIFSEKARGGWLDLQSRQDTFTSQSLLVYLEVIMSAANAIACLSSVPLTERRFLLDFPDRVQGLNMPGLYSGLTDLIVPEEPIEPDWESWLADWRTEFAVLQGRPDALIKYGKGRMPYYEQAIEGLKTDNQVAALWILLWTWTEISTLLNRGSSDNLPFRDFCESLMLGAEHFSGRVASLDAYLDVTEETIERWADHNGV